MRTSGVPRQTDHGVTGILSKLVPDNVNRYISYLLQCGDCYLRDQEADLPDSSRFEPRTHASPFAIINTDIAYVRFCDRLWYLQIVVQLKLHRMGQLSEPGGFFALVFDP